MSDLIPQIANELNTNINMNSFRNCFNTLVYSDYLECIKLNGENQKVNFHMLLTEKGLNFIKEYEASEKAKTSSPEQPLLNSFHKYKIIDETEITRKVNTVVAKPRQPEIKKPTF